MIDNSQIEKIIEERKRMHLDDPRVVEKWNELTQIFIQNEESTIVYLNSCCKENIEGKIHKGCLFCSFFNVV